MNRRVHDLKIDLTHEHGYVSCIASLIQKDTKPCPQLRATTLQDTASNHFRLGLTTFRPVAFHSMAHHESTTSRVMPGGLVKLEPREVEALPVLDVRRLPTVTINQIAARFAELCTAVRAGRADSTPAWRIFCSTSRRRIVHRVHT